MELQKRKPTRLKGYDYSQNGAYFITICTHHKRSVIDKTVGFLKMNVSKNIHNAYNEKIRQRSFHDHIIRDESDYQKIWEYIDTNPLKWHLDCYYN